MPKSRKSELPPLDWENTVVGQRIAMYRKKRGFTQKQLAELIGITQSLISDYEVGRSHLSDEMIVRLANALRCSTDNLLGTDLGSQNNVNDEIDLRFAKRMQRLSRLDPGQQKYILRTLDVLIRDAESPKTPESESSDS